MSVGVPKIVYGSRIGKTTQLRFGGFDRSDAAGESGISVMENMSSDRWPLLTVRSTRKTLAQMRTPNGLIAGNRLYWVDGDTLYREGEAVAQLRDGRKRLAFLAHRLIIFPDKAIFNEQTGELEQMEAEWQGKASIGDGTYVGIDAKGNTIRADGVDWAKIFRVGDGVTISGSTVETNNKTSVIREIEGNELRFYENCFDSEEDAELTISRKIPDLDFIFTHGNRLWGCKDDTICCSKLGDPCNFLVFDGLSTDAWEVSTGSAGSFTAAVSYRGYPCFFKEEMIYKIYGDRPGNFQTVGSASMGVAAGSADSLAVAAETLFYHHRTGIMAYTGGIPQSVSAPFGDMELTGAAGGSDGVKYFVSARDRAGNHHLMAFDTRHNLWHREDDLQCLSMAKWDGGLYAIAGGGLQLISGSSQLQDVAKEMFFRSCVELGDFTDGTTDRKGVSKLRLRIEAEEAAELTVSIQLDSDGIWRPLQWIKGGVKRSWTVPIVPIRCDHFRIRIEGSGEWTLHAATMERYTGSDR